ncbi:A disintegrin and metalloproteinase with thrombospondin motifs 9-like [Dreissena polymorpha]|uniref:A disintegrin and metalloproteinase with thrombospondin motifs 9-like n=1 Tax=Dreissena polymorpha TaxID=45954 RepID=UPI002264BB78|nr:A disintegrin and metalloproteinase with thrombospondin motifs 9-like [Dreissena polymorpha]
MEVNSIYRSHTIQQFIHIIVVKIVVFQTDGEPKITPNAGETLKRFCKWQSRNNAPEGNHLHYDTAILLTRQDICRAPEKCDTLGLAELGTMCDAERSCSVVEDNGISAAYTIAHELGHVFNLPHDGDEPCRRPAYNRDPSAKTHIMSPTIDKKTDPWSWSECSAKMLAKFLDAGLGNCLHNKPKNKKYRQKIKEIQIKKSGAIYDVDKQCALMFGRGHRHCQFQKMCSELWCTNFNGCKTQHMPMADGTICDHGKWCMKGQCVKAKQEKAVKGGWSKWSPYGKCSRSCGGGIKHATRECNNPIPSGGGRYCTGKKIKYRHCNTATCPVTADDFRLEQCAEYNSQMRAYNIPYGSKWIPKYDGIQEKDWCKLYCKADSNPSYFFMLSNKVVDGTKCRPDDDDICVSGQCRRAGCDNKLGSNMKRDRCGVCGGDNGSCKTITGTYNTIQSDYNTVTVIPAGATNIDIRQHGYVYDPSKKGDENYLVLVNSQNEYLFNGQYLITQYPMTVKVKGAALFYTGSATVEERINSTGTLGENLTLQVLSVGDLNPPDIHFSYTMSLRSDEVRFSWKEDTEWTDCDDICNGRRYRKVKCVRDDTHSPVSEQRCENEPKPNVESERCNPFCTISWRVLRDDCSSNCGQGIAKQYVSCLLTTRHNTTVVDMEHCMKRTSIIGPRPLEQVTCFGKCLDTQWKYSAWTECTATCGGGVQKRSFTCVDSRGSELSESYCSAKDRLLERECNADPCPVWKVHDWTACSVTCGRGSHHRKVTCHIGDKEVIETQCDHKQKPANKLECNLGQCPDWIAEEWGECSASCGEGVKQRYVTCMDSTGAKADPSDCDLESKPTDNASCLNRACGYWRMGEWSKCSKTCSAGTQTRVVVCTLLERQTAEEVHCDLDVKPESERACVLEECSPEDLEIGIIVSNTVVGISHWRIGPWSACSASCGTGWQRRLVQCHDEKGPSENCADNQKPEGSQSCDAGPCPTWVKGEWSQCSKSCGDMGMQKRTVVCQLSDGATLPESSCDIFNRPPDTGICNNGACSKRRTWQVGPWAPCSVTCGTGSSQREVICVSESGIPHPSSECDDQKPRNTKRCTKTPCPSWAYTKWGKCSTSCGTGTQHRQVVCRVGSRDIVPHDLCLNAKRPKAEKKCNQRPCSDYMWKAMEWSNCTKDCGFGMKTREVICTNIENEPVNSSLCDVEKRPKDRRRCSEFPCPFMWNTSPWSECSASCGEGSQSRRAVCQAVTKEGWILPGEVPYGCKISDRPPESQICNHGPCQARYKWVVAPWGECSTRCGHGVERRLVQCVDPTGKKKTKKLCSKAHRPDGRRPCYNGPCFARSCKQLKEETSIRQDGSYKLFVRGRLLEIYCKNMRDKFPEEFLTLPAGDVENFSEIYPFRLKRRRTCPNNGTRPEACTECRDRPYQNAGKTSYSKVKIDLLTLQLQVTDQSFSTSINGKHIPLGTAGDCYSSGDCPQGRFLINLSGTGLAVTHNTTWVTQGKNSSQRIERIQDGEIVQGWCGGLCGWCSPQTGIQLTVLS